LRLRLSLATGARVGAGDPDVWLLGIAPILLDPTAQRRDADAKIRCHLLKRQAADQR